MVAVHIFAIVADPKKGRVSTCTPLPHVTEQVPLFHGPYLQGVGQGLGALQGFFSYNLGHLTLAGGLPITFRVRIWEPVPHCALHLDHLPHGPTLHLPLQGCQLQPCIFCLVGPQAFPPGPAFFTIARVLVRSPPPQGFEHVDHGPQGPITQSFRPGHFASLHGLKRFCTGHCASRNPAAGLRLCAIIPVPQVTEQAPTSFHFPYLQPGGTTIGGVGVSGT